MKPTLLLITLLLSLTSLAAERDPIPARAAPQLGGYSPVSYFTEGRAEPGRLEHAVAYEGRVYYLTSAAQVETFYREPDRYQARFPVCPFSLTTGAQMAIDPTNFKVVGDTLLLFHRSQKMDGLAAWNASGLSDEALIERADKQYLLLRF
ncbi:MAG: hypothetical protein AAGI15_04640 [Pseudomonadota bacterium]